MARTAYRRDIDGLRAVAVLSVLAYHYGAPFPGWLQLPGGFTGVDVFFVISGFLITSILADEIAAGEFSVLGFYDRRIRRIVPALLVMLGVVLLSGYFLLAPGDYKSLASSAAYAAFGLSNFFFLDHTGYFDQSADLLPLIHTWSLAVEEQFYVVWPVALFTILAGRARSDFAAVAAIVLIAVAGFCESLLWFGRDPKAAFFLATPRAWELALGAVLVFLPLLPRRFGEIATVAGLILIGVGFFAVSAQSFPGHAALYPCVGAALVIWPRRAATATGAWLGYLSPVGLISYSLYLWHWPVWVMYRVYINNGVPRIREALALAVVSITLAALSYRFVEQPFRKRRWKPVQSVAVGLLACALVFGGASYIERGEGFPARISPGVYAMRSLAAMWDWPCKTTPVAKGMDSMCTFGAPWEADSDKAILWGDSNAEMLAPLLEQGARQANVSVAYFAPCPAIYDGEAVLTDNEIFPGYGKGCAQSRLQMLNLLSARPDIKKVILAGSWQKLMYDLHGGPQSAGKSQEQLLEFALSDIVSRLLSLQKQVVLISTIPQWSHDPLPCAMLGVGLIRRQCSDQQRYLFKTEIDERQTTSRAVFQGIAAKYPKAVLIVPDDRLCATEHCITWLAGEYLYRDRGHFRRNLSNETKSQLSKLIGIDRIFD